MVGLGGTVEVLEEVDMAVVVLVVTGDVLVGEVLVGEVLGAAVLVAEVPFVDVVEVGCDVEDGLVEVDDFDVDRVLEGGFGVTTTVVEVVC